MENILTINNLTKKFGYLTAVKDLSFTIQKGNVYGILGPNGSGKSTTLGIVLNVVNKTHNPKMDRIFNNTTVAFAHKTTKELRKARIIF